jgi:DNA-directed RNA polymerase subunit M/transcription elongation factor TFIIS
MSMKVSKARNFLFVCGNSKCLYLFREERRREREEMTFIYRNTNCLFI